MSLPQPATKGGSCPLRRIPSHHHGVTPRALEKDQKIDFWIRCGHSGNDRSFSCERKRLGTLALPIALPPWEGAPSRAAPVAEGPGDLAEDSDTQGQLPAALWTAAHENDVHLPSPPSPTGEDPNTSRNVIRMGRVQQLGQNLQAVWLLVSVGSRQGWQRTPFFFF